MASGKRALLDDDDEDAEETEKSLELGFNEKYAQRFTHNKKREDLHRLQELQKKGLAGGESDDDDDDESSSEEEDDDGLLPARTEEKIFETLAKIKKRDPIIYSADTNFFGNDDDDEEEEELKKEKKQKPLYLKDVNARQLLEGGNGNDDEDVEKPKKPPTSYLSEQEELKRAFLLGVREAEEQEEDDLLRVKKRTKEELEREALETEEAVEEAEQRAKDRGITKRLEEYFGKDDDLDDNDRFLKEYLLNKGWIDADQKEPTYPTYHDDAEDISEDEEALDKQDQFEKDYNFRFQDGADNTYVKGHSRIIVDSVRKKSETRKKQREKKKERESEEAGTRREELKRLKNVKKKEVLEKLSKIRAVAGLSTAPSDDGGERGVDILGADDLDEDFDPDEYDKKMKEAFGEEYYDADDPDFVEGEEEFDEIGHADFDADDDLAEIAPEGDGASAGFAAVKAKLEQEGKNKKKKVKVPFEEKLLIDKHLEEYYKLDYEDVIGDLPTRFKYRPVKPNKYGLKTKDIIGLEDKELNQYVSLKKLAPYTTEEWEPRRPAPRSSSKARKKKALNSEDSPKRKKAEIAVDENGANSVDTRKKKKKSVIAVDDFEGVENVSSGEHANGEPLVSETVEAGGEKAKKSRKRKKSGAVPVLPESRLLSYGTPSGKRKGEGTPKKKKVKR
ncbi:unnamed protein product [Calypogeia fissa]